MPDPVRGDRLPSLLPPGICRVSAHGQTPSVSGFVPARLGLRPISITRQRLKQLDAIQLVREQRGTGKQELAYHARPFVLCGLPLRRPPAGELVHRRQNGKFFLEVVAHPTYGLPFGQDRLIPIWVSTLAVKQKSRTVHFQRAAQLLEFLHLPKDGIHYRRLIQGFERIFAASMFFGTDEERVCGRVFDGERFHFFDRMRLWFNRGDQPESPAHDEADDVITLSESFYDEINHHPIPVERHVVAGLANAPGLLDFYVWIVWKSWAVKAVPARIPLFGPQGLQAQLGAATCTRNKRFRQTLRQWLQRIKLFWPECPAEASHDGKFLIIRSSIQAPAIHQATA